LPEPKVLAHAALFSTLPNGLRHIHEAACASSDEYAARFVALGERRLKGFADKAQVSRFEWRD
jgi:hypothetical protein